MLDIFDVVFEFMLALRCNSVSGGSCGVVVAVRSCVEVSQRYVYVLVVSDAL